MLLIIGGTGTIGLELVRLLRERGAPFRALVRDRPRAAALLGPAAPLVEGDLAWPDSLAAALDDVTHVFLLTRSGPDQVELQGNLVRAAQRHGGVHVVKLSGSRPTRDRSRRVDHWHAQTEAQIRESGLPCTFLRPNLFAQNFYSLYRDSIRRAGIVATPTTGRVAFVDTRDIAAAAAAVLTQHGHAGRTYTLTGPHALTFAGAAEALARGLGRPVAHVPITHDELAADLRAAQLPDWQRDDLVAVYRAVDDGAAAEVTPDIERLTGRPPRDLTTFARDHAALFR